MLGIELICSDAECALVDDVCVEGLDRVDHTACERCGASTQVVAVWDVPEAAAIESVAQPIMLPRRTPVVLAALRQAA